jgi:hypothetical protein
MRQILLETTCSQLHVRGSTHLRCDYFSQPGQIPTCVVIPVMRLSYAQ